MSDRHDSNKGEVILSRNRSLAIKRSGLVKRGLELVHEIKKRQVEVLIGNVEPSLTDIFSEFIKKVIKDKYDLKVRSAFYGEDLLELAENGAVDIFILVLNNIQFRPDYPFQERMGNSLQLITQIKTTYRRPVIALSGWIEDSPLIARAKLDADFFFPLPFEPDAFMEAIEKCLNMLPSFDEIP